MNNTPIRLLELSGTPYEIGLTHGRTFKQSIQRYTNERVSLVQSGTWSGGHLLSREQVLDLAAACLPAHRDYSPDLYEEMQGMSDGAGVSMAELVITSGFTDFIDTVYGRYAGKVPQTQAMAADDCTAFIVPDQLAGGAGFFGQTWDMHDTATEFVILLRLASNGRPGVLVFTTTGCLGQIGMNAHGIAIGINNLSGADGDVGVTWPFVIRKALQQDNIDDALACITGAPLAGAHNYLLFDRTGRGYNVEAMPTQQKVTAVNDRALVHTNHCLYPETLSVSQRRDPELQAASEARLDTAAKGLLSNPVTIEDLKKLTRQDAICVRAKPPYHVESCGAAIMRPKTGDFWAVWGLPAENRYEHFHV